MNRFYSNGKLLITGEYLVLDGAKALAVPTKFGQDLIVEPLQEPVLIWESYTVEGNEWFSAEFDLPKIRLKTATFFSDTEGKGEMIAETLQGFLKVCKELNPEFLTEANGFLVKTNLTFPQDWGLGSSSTLLNNLAEWAKVNPFELLEKSFSGSGYDLACAKHNQPILFQKNGINPIVEEVDFKPEFSEELFFVYLNQKQNSRSGIKRYREFKGNISAYVQEIDVLTKELLETNSIKDFEKIIKEHEAIISRIIDNRPIQDIVFKDYFGQVKSLGAWGGDFVLATGNENSKKYFTEKGFSVILPYKEMVL
ncbi:GYDIA family GHMP kinase [Aureivirga sp. CE67]|uniref:GYDIA family GHMP kinase n=1 Tax=Aureivirga sp. CE67 TaxID=1788983 RepID=UPI0018CB3D80|nr:GYDIA family GHMP kinase [Aureivirga sp. CE67]